MKRKIYTTGICMACSILGVLLLYHRSKDLNSAGNGFLRLFPPHVLREINHLDITYNSYYIAGLSSGTVYLGNLTAPDLLLVVRSTRPDTQFLRIRIPDRYRNVPGYSAIKVDSPDIFFSEGINSVILHGNLKDKTLAATNFIDSIPFDASAPISATSSIIRTFDFSKQAFILAKKTNGQLGINRSYEALSTMREGRFSVDGMLSCNRQSGKLIYLYYYRNEFTCLDTNLHILYKGKTIDTTHARLIILDTIRSSHKIMPAAPLTPSNKLSCVAENRLYICSGLIANNEEREDFDRSSVIDTYDLKDGHYLYSFYIPNLDGSAVKDIKVHDRTLAVLYNSVLVVFHLNFG